MKKFLIIAVLALVSLSSCTSTAYTYDVTVDYSVAGTTATVHDTISTYNQPALIYHVYDGMHNGSIILQWSALSFDGPNRSTIVETSLPITAFKYELKIIDSFEANIWTGKRK